MKKVFVIISVILLSFFFISCPMSFSPHLISIEFIDDSTMEYKFSFTIGENASNYSVKKMVITPDDDYHIRYQTFSVTKGEIFLNKKVPDGVTVYLEFYDSDGNYVLSYSFVKGEEKEEF